MTRLTSVYGSFRARVVAARLQDEGFDVELRGSVDNPYALTVGEMARVDLYVPNDQVDDASLVLLATEVDEVDDAGQHVRVGNDPGLRDVLLLAWRGLRHGLGLGALRHLRTARTKPPRRQPHETHRPVTERQTSEQAACGREDHRLVCRRRHERVSAGERARLDARRPLKPRLKIRRPDEEQLQALSLVALQVHEEADFLEHAEAEMLRLVDEDDRVCVGWYVR